MPATTTGKSYHKAQTKDGVPYRVRKNKSGLGVVLVSLEIPEETFLWLHSTKGRLSFTQRAVQVLEAK